MDKVETRHGEQAPPSGPVNPALGELARLEHALERNLLPLCILAALALSLHASGPGVALSRLHLTGWLVALIFLGEGVKLDLSRLASPRRYAKPVVLGAVVAFGFFPAGAYLLAQVFALSPSYMVGLVLISCLPCSLASAMVIASNAGGDSVAALCLLLSLNIIGLVAVPECLQLWLGGSVHVDDVDIMLKLVLYLFAPMTAGQLLKRAAPGFVRRIRPALRYIPAVCIGLIIYAWCSKESRLIAAQSVEDIILVAIPSVLLHASALALSYGVGRRVLNLEPRVNRAVAVVCSEKPLSLAVALWSLSFAKSYPLAIFPPVVFAILQVLLDSVWASHLQAGEAA
ncbi:MAG: solute carrier family 10 (sodium/bile acid cotransporter), er 7 [Desulfovibrionales bacterium]|jgi:predicted Na+-dependent transporter|nr:solute carrier family 10 (sodium/bile acid cotransporter), er 7 [Desulfovibrionales bacterium]